MVFGSFTVARQLLDARADATQRMDAAGNRTDAFILASFFGKSCNVKDWLLYFDGSWPLERTEGIGSSALTAANFSSAALELSEVLLAARADINHLNHMGSSILYNAGGNENSEVGVVSKLVEANADVNELMIPRTFKWRTILCVARWAARCGTSMSLLLEQASFGGSTPLMSAARLGKAAEVQEMIAAKADITIRNLHGLTALDFARQKFGGAVPRILQNLLDKTETPEITLVEPFAQFS
jgi:hypothetical protein